MKVELSIADDRELKSHIRDVIKGEVVSIARGEIKAILADVIKEGVVPKDAGELDGILRGEIRKLINEAIGNRYNNETLRAAVKEVAKELVKDILAKGEY